MININTTKGYWRQTIQLQRHIHTQSTSVVTVVYGDVVVSKAILYFYHVFGYHYFTSNSTAGKGVCLRMWIMEKIGGQWPSLAPTNSILQPSEQVRFATSLLAPLYSSAHIKARNNLSAPRLPGWSKEAPVKGSKARQGHKNRNHRGESLESTVGERLQRHRHRDQTNTPAHNSRSISSNFAPLIPEYSSA